MEKEHEGTSRADERPGAQAVIQVTDLGLVWKRSPREIFVYAFSYHTGSPIAKAGLRLLTEENELLAEVVTDEHGTARLPDSGKSAWLLADSGEDLHAVSLHDYGLPLYGFRVPVEYSEERAERRVMLFSDRPVYKPGETLHLKAICRNWKNEQLAIPASGKARLRFFDAKGQNFLEQTNLALSPVGSLSSSIVLPDGPLGSIGRSFSWMGRPSSTPFSCSNIIQMRLRSTSDPNLHLPPERRSRHL